MQALTKIRCFNESKVNHLKQTKFSYVISNLFYYSVTAENIVKVLETAIADWEIPKRLGTIMVTDNASNMVKGLNLSVADLYTCCIHTLQLAIGSFFFNISQLISICHLR